jgi:hypothetical protein
LLVLVEQVGIGFAHDAQQPFAQEFPPPLEARIAIAMMAMTCAHGVSLHCWANLNLQFGAAVSVLYVTDLTQAGHDQFF